ncbi:MAG: hypothetical protein ACXV5R_09820, partial [Candidatus Angelobacter sp.]
MTKPIDDLEAVRSIAAALEEFEPKDQERILRWARERVGLPAPPVTLTSVPAFAPAEMSGIGVTEVTRDIRTFLAQKDPHTDNQLAATVAYFYKFLAPEHMRKESISAEELQEACRLASRARLRHPIKTLTNAHASGLLD